MPATRPAVPRPSRLRKCQTGVRGLDEITQGGLPRGRTSLICGGPGCGKTLLAAEFIVRGISEFKEPGVFMAFEETVDDLASNVASLGFDLKDLIRRGLLAADYVRIEKSEIEETGEYDLEGLFVRLGSLIDEVGAKRVALDTLEALFAGLSNEGIIRAELRRLFRWLKDKRVTSVITAEQGDNALTRHGLEEYVSDCVILLDHRVINQVATRRLRVVKYRGSGHGTDEYPTTIDERGLNVLPISSLGLTYPVSGGRLSSGIKQLDMMLDGKGFYRGSSILVSGTAGTGKSSIASSFLGGVCAHGQRGLYVSFEESSAQIKRNMASIGLGLARWESRGLLKFHCLRPSLYGLEIHLGTLNRLIGDFAPAAIVMDPITSLIGSGRSDEVKAMLVRMIDFIKNLGITALFTSLTGGENSPEQSEVGISSLMDTWILLQSVQADSERNRILYILKSRGMAHSNQMREFQLTDDGIVLSDVYVGPGAVLTGSARIQQEARDRARAADWEQAVDHRRRELGEQQLDLEAQLRSLKLRMEAVQRGLAAAAAEDRSRSDRGSMAKQAIVIARRVGSDRADSGRAVRRAKGKGRA